jgi:Cu/Zn superoxide dismutase
MPAFDPKRTLDNCRLQLASLMREEPMKVFIVTLAATTIGAGAAYAASKTVTMNAIDATGVGKQIGTLRLTDTKAGLQIAPRLVDLPVVPENLIRADSRHEVESAHHST